jgi:hypothetical protein
MRAGWTRWTYCALADAGVVVASPNDDGIQGPEPLVQREDLDARDAVFTAKDTDHSFGGDLRDREARWRLRPISASPGAETVTTPLMGCRAPDGRLLSLEGRWPRRQPVERRASGRGVRFPGA